MESERLKTSEIATHRAQQLKKQKFICPLCGTFIKPQDAALDHDHDTGLVRAVLHKNCNSVEGRVLSWLRRVQRTDPKSFLINLLQYWEQDYSGNPEHPTHRTDTEKEILKCKRRRARCKTARGKAKWTQKIKALQNQK